jgi:hypothetical protein
VVSTSRDLRNGAWPSARCRHRGIGGQLPSSVSVPRALWVTGGRADVRDQDPPRRTLIAKRADLSFAMNDAQRFDRPGQLGIAPGLRFALPALWHLHRDGRPDSRAMTKDSIFRIYSMTAQSGLGRAII